MNAVDTNVIVRLLTNDDKAQTVAAQNVLAAGPIWIAKTVLLETAWVLERVYGYSDELIREAFMRLLGMPEVYAEDESDIIQALALAAKGLDLPDAIHLVSRPPETKFISFDQTLVKRAARAGATGVTMPAYIM